MFHCRLQSHTASSIPEARGDRQLRRSSYICRSHRQKNNTERAHSGLLIYTVVVSAETASEIAFRPTFAQFDCSLQGRAVSGFRRTDLQGRFSDSRTGLSNPALYKDSPVGYNVMDISYQELTLIPC